MVLLRQAALKKQKTLLIYELQWKQRNSVYIKKARLKNIIIEISPSPIAEANSPKAPAHKSKSETKTLSMIFSLFFIFTSSFNLSLVKVEALGVDLISSGERK